MMSSCRYCIKSLLLYKAKSGLVSWTKDMDLVSFLEGTIPNIFLLTIPRRCFFCGSFLLLMFCVCHAYLSFHCSLVVTCWERADLLTGLYVKFSCVLSLFHFWCSGSGVVLDCIDSWSLLSCLLCKYQKCISPFIYRSNFVSHRFGFSFCELIIYPIDPNGETLVCDSLFCISQHMWGITICLKFKPKHE